MSNARPRYRLKKIGKNTIRVKEYPQPSCTNCDKNSSSWCVCKTCRKNSEIIKRMNNLLKQIDREVKKRDKQAKKFDRDLEKCDLPEDEAFENYHVSYQSGLLRAKHLIQKELKK